MLICLFMQAVVQFLKKWLKRAFITLVVVFISFHVLVVGLLKLWQTQPVHASMFMLSHQLFSDTKLQQHWVNADAISTHMKRAVIASEDAKFVQHDGFDVDAMKAAFEKNQQKGRVRAGGSTITQQLAKNLFLTSHRSYVRKGEEAIITYLIENIWSKKRILTVYLNVVEFGDGIFGVEAASQHYFNKPASKLGKAQAALLASMLPRPKYYQKNLKNPHLQRKKRVIMKRMRVSQLPIDESD